MRPIVVAEALEFGQLGIQGADAELAGAGLVELAAVGRVGTRAGTHVAKLRDRADGLGLLDRETGLDGAAQVVDLRHLARLSPTGAVAAERGSGAADHLQGGRLRSTFAANLVEQREPVEAARGESW